MPAFHLQSGAAWYGDYKKRDRLVAYELAYEHAVDTRLGVYAVIDGVSDSNAGRKAVRTVNQALSYPHTYEWIWTPTVMETLLQYCNDVLLRRQETTGETGAVAVTMAHVCGGIANVVSVGHTRAYLLRSETVRQITADHIDVNKLARERRLFPTTALTPPQCEHLESHLGMPEPIVDRFAVRIQHSDRLVLCSSGIWDVVPTQRMTSIVCDNTPQAACDTLVEIARNSAAVVDNATVIVVHVTAVGQDALHTERKESLT